VDRDQVKPYVNAVYLTGYKSDRTGEDMKYVSGNTMYRSLINGRPLVSRLRCDNRPCCE